MLYIRDSVQEIKLTEDTETALYGSRQTENISTLVVVVH